MQLENTSLYQQFGTVVKWIPAVLIIIALIVFVIIMIRRSIKNNPKDHALGKTVKARVLSKRERKRRDPNISPYDRNLAGVITNFYYVTFETRSFEHIELLVPGDVYHSLPEDQTGTLTYEGSRFIDFIPGEWL